MQSIIDLGWRPRTYFRPEALERFLVAEVKGAAMRRQLKALLADGRHEDFERLLNEVALSEPDRRLLEAIHPAFMGGNYLPDASFGEVEIARITIQSTTSDVTCVYARPEEGRIFYRVVDEYGGDTLQGPAETSTTVPMTLGEFADFFMTAWPLVDVARCSFEDDLDGALDFFGVDSEFYPDLGRLLSQRVIESYSRGT